MNAPTPHSIAVIGAGITGLTAAFALQRRGQAVVVYDSSPRPGGVIRSWRENGFLAESGPNTILETSPRISALIEDLGLADRRRYAAPRSAKRFVVRDGKPVEMPHSAATFLTTPLFSGRAKLRLLAEPFVRRWPANEEEDLAHFVERRLGREFLDYAINPFVAGVYAGDPRHLSVKEAFPKLHALEHRYGSLLAGQFLGARARRRRAEVSKSQAKQFSFDQGLQTLIEALQTRLADALELSTSVDTVRQTADGWLIESRGPGGPQAREHSAVIYAGTAHRLPEIELLDGERIDGARLLQIQYPPVASLTLGFRRAEIAHPLDGFGVLIPEVERFNILGAIFSSSLFPHRAPEGHVTLTCFLGGARAPHLAGLEAGARLSLALHDLRRLLGATGDPVFAHQSVFPQAIPQYEVGYGRFKEWMNQLEVRAPGLFLAGAYRNGISLGDSIVSGLGVAPRAESFVTQDSTAPEPSLSTA